MKAEAATTVTAVPDTSPIAVYYGSSRLDRLALYRRVVLQPEAYPPAELAELRRRGTEPLGHLSLSEDYGPPAVWHRDRSNPDWGGVYVHVDHPAWVQHVVDRARAIVAQGFAGLFLNSLNVELTFPEDVPHLLTLIAAVREEARPGYLLANRGFGLLPHLTDLVDGVLFESFSVRWLGGGYAAWPPDVLEQHATIAEQLLSYDLDLYALDYADAADSTGLADFAGRRAGLFCLHSFVSDRNLSRV
jgi:polysaccharide biosynthesis protein PelA